MIKKLKKLFHQLNKEEFINQKIRNKKIPIMQLKLYLIVGKKKKLKLKYSINLKKRFKMIIN